MAGGAGTRLWPLSRKHRPKQWLKLFGGKTLLRQAYERAAHVIPAEAINVITGQVHLRLTAQELPELRKENLIGEPVGRDTVNAIGLGAAILSKRDPDAVMGVLTADHIITPLDRFRRAMEVAYETAEKYPDALVTFGIRPTGPNTSYGYIERGAALDAEARVFEVKHFTEKPNLALATRYVASGEYYWNSGMFAWRAATILAELKRQLPNSYEALMEIAEVWGTPEARERLGLLYPTLMKISVDFAIMERAPKVLVVEMDCHWIDVGSWTALEAIVDADAQGNVAVCSHYVGLGSRGNIFVSEEEHLIAAIGVDDLVVLHSPDATLICAKRDVQGLKELVDTLRQRYGEQWL